MILTASQPARLTIIAAPSGRFVFVGTVPPALAFEWEAESDLAAAMQCGPGVAQRIAERNGRTFKTRSFETRKAAGLAAAEWNGFVFLDDDGTAYFPA